MSEASGPARPGQVHRAAGRPRIRPAGSPATAALALLGAAGAAAAAASRPGLAASAAGQDWPPFVLVAGLLLVGVVADEGGLFHAAGACLARAARRDVTLFAGAAAGVALVSAVLNLDTAVALLTPVLVHTARRRGSAEGPLLYGSVLLANAGSLLLPGSNLTNLIVAGHLHLTGSGFVARTWPAWLVAVAVTAVVAGLAGRRELAGRRPARPGPAPAADAPPRPSLLAAAVVVAAAALVVTLRDPALPVLAVGAGGAAARVVAGRVRAGHALGSVGVPTLVGLLGVAVALGTLGRAWSGPAVALSHLGAWATAGMAAGASVALNNLPAASLLAARIPPHPLPLLVGLNLGPNFAVSGSLSWLLWLRAGRAAGATPSLARASRIGAVAAALSMAAALGTLALAGTA